MANPFTSMEGAVWLQREGANSEPLYLGCHMLDEVQRPRGSNELLRCPDRSGPNKYETVGKLKAPPDLVSFTIDADITPIIDYLETVETGWSLLVNQLKSGRKDLVTNWDRAFVITECDIVNETLAGLASKDENIRSTQAMEVEGEELLRVYVMNAYRASITETEAMNKVFTCDNTGSVIWATADAASGVAADVWYDSGSGWTAAAAAPFAADEHITAGFCVPLNRSTNRIYVFRGSTDAGNAAEAAYSDDDGATWTLTDIGATNGEFVAAPSAAYAVDLNNIWVGTDGGYIYYSDNGGVSWTTQEAGVMTANGWNWIEMLDASNGWAGGADGVVAITADGGATWSQTTLIAAGAVDIKDGAALTALDAWVVDDAGVLYYTDDGGTTWTTRQDFGTEAVTSISFLNEFQGMLTYGTTSGVVYITKDGGFTWEAIQTPSNDGFNSSLFITNQLAYTVGEVTSATGYVLKLQPLV